MRIRSVTVTASGVFSNPLESYSNIRPGVTLQADVADDENFDEAVRTLQGVANTLLIGHKGAMVARLRGEQKDRERRWEEERRARQAVYAAGNPPAGDESPDDDEDEDFDDEDAEDIDLDDKDDDEPEGEGDLDA